MVRNRVINKQIVIKLEFNMKFLKEVRRSQIFMQICRNSASDCSKFVLNFSQFQPMFSYKLCSYKKESLYCSLGTYLPEFGNGAPVHNMVFG